MAVTFALKTVNEDECEESGYVAANVSGIVDTKNGEGNQQLDDVVEDEDDNEDIYVCHCQNKETCT